MRSDTDHVERPGAGDTDEAGSFANQRGADDPALGVRPVEFIKKMFC
jgi:hypothetical protein